MQTDQRQQPLSVAHDSVAFLRQGIDLLAALSDDLYVSAMPPVYASSVGAHVRHILDHFRCLMDGMGTGEVDYDRRARDATIETQRHTAIAEMRALVERLHDLREDQRGLRLRVKMDCGGGRAANDWSDSTLARELQFLTSHTIHHYALVAAILDHAGHRPPAEFGVSPSTLNYERRRRAQAR